MQFLSSSIKERCAKSVSKQPKEKEDKIKKILTGDRILFGIIFVLKKKSFFSHPQKIKKIGNKLKIGFKKKSFPSNAVILPDTSWISLHQIVCRVSVLYEE